MKNSIITISRIIAVPFVFILTAILIFTLNKLIQDFTYGEIYPFLSKFLGGAFAYGFALIISFQVCPVKSRLSLILIFIFSLVFLAIAAYHSNFNLNENTYNIEYTGNLTGLCLGFLFIYIYKL